MNDNPGKKEGEICRSWPGCAPHPPSILHFMRADLCDDAAAKRWSIITRSKIRPELQKMSFSSHGTTISSLHAAPLCLQGDNHIIRSGWVLHHCCLITDMLPFSLHTFSTRHGNKGTKSSLCPSRPTPRTHASVFTRSFICHV